MNNPLHVWPKVIILIDMNCFFAAVEQLDNSYWRGLPIAVTNGSQGTTIITSSYEASAYGVKTGMKLYEARLLCPGLIQALSRPDRYAAVSIVSLFSFMWMKHFWMSHIASHCWVHH